MKKLLLSAGLLASGAVLTISEYFFKYAMTPFNKKSDPKDFTGQDSLYGEKVWFNNFHKQIWYLKTKSNLKLFAQYLDNHADKTAILLHGFMSDGDSMAGFAKMFYDFGYNVLIPDARAHGRSEGKYIGYGWVEKEDILNWIEQVIAKNTQKQKIVVMGQSMGGATTMMVSGLKLPSQVKCFIEDCGYSNVSEEITHQAKLAVGLADAICKPVVKAVSWINKFRNDFFIEGASAVKQLSKNTRPIFFIHGGKDQVVPTRMVYENYQATKAPKQLWIAPIAGHAQTFPLYKNQYRKKVKEFLQKYV